MDEEYYQKKGTLQTCPYSAEPSIITSSGSVIDKSQCSHATECSIALCPLEQELKRF